MKQFSYTVAKIKNSSGEYEPIPALRGMTSYEAAVEAGYTGSREEWLALTIRALDDGWVTKYEQLEANKANKSDTYTKTETDNIINGLKARDIQVSPSVSAITDVSLNVDESLVYLAESAALSSYMVLVTNANQEAISAALGKNNAGLVHGVGRALAMYAHYKDPENIIGSLDEYFPNLVMCDRLTPVCLTAPVCEEIMNDATLHELFESNDFMHERLVYYATPTNNRLFYKGITETIPDGFIFSGKTSYDITLTLTPSIDEVGLRLTASGNSTNNLYHYLSGNSNIQTNGAKYLCFKMSPTSNNVNAKFGIVDDTGVLISDKSTNVISNKAYAIDISGLDYIKLGLYSHLVDGTVAATFDYVVLSNFAIV